jgi:hypothetical protein
MKRKDGNGTAAGRNMAELQLIIGKKSRLVGVVVHT